jgi:hypothetical protein
VVCWCGWCCLGFECLCVGVWLWYDIVVCVGFVVWLGVWCLVVCVGCCVAVWRCVCCVFGVWLLCVVCVGVLWCVVVCVLV